MSKFTAPLVATALASVVAIGLVSQHRKSDRLEAAITTLQADKKIQDHKVQELTRLLSELLEIEKSPAPVAAMSATANRPAESVAADEPDSAITTKAPAGWRKNGTKSDAYVVGVDRTTTLGGMPSAYVKSVGSNVDGFGGMMQGTAATEYQGKRVRLSGWVKTENTNDGGGRLWLRVDGQEKGAMLGFDNMEARPVRGSTSWQEYSVVLDVPNEAAALAYGFFVSGAGQMWVSGTKLETVSTDVPSTNMLDNPARSLPKTPANLKFD